MRNEGYDVKVINIQDLSAIKAKYQIPFALQSCHTAIVDGYIIEGHGPAAEVTRLLAERPSDILGLAVPGMPVGSPGMEGDGTNDQPYDVLTFDASGKTSVYASYRP